MNKAYKIELIADLVQDTISVEDAKTVASTIQLPPPHERQFDLAYFTAIFISTGTNKNYFNFTADELLKARDSIVNKPVDIEHNEGEIIGHIYRHSFVDDKYKKVNINDLFSMPEHELRNKNIHIEIACVIYKDRFPNIIDDIKKGVWKVSMETFYDDFDVKVGDVVMSKEEAKSVGINPFDDNIYGVKAEIYNAPNSVTPITIGHIEKKAKKLHFSGVGIVEDPANPKSVILKVAASNEDSIKNNDCIKIVLNNLTKNNIDNKLLKEYANMDTNICQYFKEVPAEGLSDSSAKGNWCYLYDQQCPVKGASNDPGCLKLKDVGDSNDSNLNTYETVTPDVTKAVSSVIRRFDKVDDRLNKLIRKINSRYTV